MNYLTNPIVKASLALSLSILLLLGVGFGSVHYYKKGEAQRNKTAVAQLETKVAEATKTADFHEARANDIANQRDGMIPVLAKAEKDAAKAKAELKRIMEQPEPTDLTGELSLRTEQRDAAVVALHAEEADHAATKHDRDLAVEEVKELKITTTELRTGLTSQIQLTASVSAKLESEQKWRVRYRNLSIGFGLVLGGAAAQNYISHR